MKIAQNITSEYEGVQYLLASTAPCVTLIGSNVIISNCKRGDQFGSYETTPSRICLYVCLSVYLSVCLPSISC